MDITVDTAQSGLSLETAEKALVLLHGRGASAASILPLADALDAKDFAVLAPQAVGGQWYPQRFTAPREQNEPYLSQALAGLESLLTHITDAGIEANNIIFGGFSQGACLAAEFVASHAQPYGGLLVFSGGLIGAGPSVTASEYSGSLYGTPVFVGCSDVDPHIPLERVNETIQILSDLGANVNGQIYPGMAHTITQEELDEARKVVRSSH